MAKAKRKTRLIKNYLNKRDTERAARKGIREAAANTMELMGYTIVVQDGWVVKKDVNGIIEKIEPVASQEETSPINLD